MKSREKTIFKLASNSYRYPRVRISVCGKTIWIVSGTARAPEGIATKHQTHGFDIKLDLCRPLEDLKKISSQLPCLLFVLDREPLDKDYRLGFLKAVLLHDNGYGIPLAIGTIMSLYIPRVEVVREPHRTACRETELTAEILFFWGEFNPQRPLHIAFHDPKPVVSICYYSD